MTSTLQEISELSKHWSWDMEYGSDESWIFILDFLIEKFDLKEHGISASLNIDLCEAYKKEAAKINRLNEELGLYEREHNICLMEYRHLLNRASVRAKGAFDALKHASNAYTLFGAEHDLSLLYSEALKKNRPQVDE